MLWVFCRVSNPSYTMLRPYLQNICKLPEKTRRLLILMFCSAAKAQYEACLHQYFILERYGFVI